MKRNSYVGFGTETENVIFCTDVTYNGIEDDKNAYLHIRGNTDEEGPIRISPRELRALANKLIKLADKIDKR